MSLSVSLGLILGAFKYYAFDPSIIARRNSSTTLTNPLVPLHVFLGAVWLISGFFQFTKFSQRRLRLHKINGYIYLFSSLFSLLSLFVISYKLQQSAPFGVGVLPLSLYTLICIFTGFIFIKRKDIENHRAWMLRSMSMPFFMAFDRLGYSLSYELMGEYWFPDFHAKMFILIIIELIVYRKLDFDLIKFESKLLRTFIKILCLGVSLILGLLTFLHEIKYMNATL